MIQYILFDFDGTLVDSKEIAVLIFNQLAEKYNFKKVDKEHIKYLRTLSIMERCRFLNLPFYKIPWIVLESRALYKSYIQKLIPFDGIKSMLEELKNMGLNLVVLSSNSESNIRTFLQKNQPDTFNTIYTSSNIFGKDAVIKRFLKAHKLNSCQVIYVGDELRDIIACRKSGVEVVWVSWGYDSIEAVRGAKPDFIINKPEEILEVVKSKSL
jgi:phosphoglycolate phosphatase